ncbi:MAG: spore germination protein [Eubacterium sp.]|nr:spore germination protein [Eubacterium sp.]
MLIYDKYNLNLEKLKSDFKDCSDFLIREIIIDGRRAIVAAMDGLINGQQLNNMIMAPLFSHSVDADNPTEHFDIIKKQIVAPLEMNEVNTFEKCEFFMMSGFAAFILDGYPGALVLGVQGWSRRTTDEPVNEAMVKGAKECFVETLNDNKALLRKRLKTPHLKMKQIKLGKTATTPVVIVYVDDRAPEGTVKEIESRLFGAELNSAFDYGCLEPFIGSDIPSFFQASEIPSALTCLLQSCLREESA